MTIRYKPFCFMINALLELLKMIKHAAYYRNKEEN